MKRVFHKPIGHFIPLVSGVKAEDLATLNEAELAELLQRCKEQEAACVYQANPDFVITQVAAVKLPLAFKRDNLRVEKCFYLHPSPTWLIQLITSKLSG